MSSTTMQPLLALADAGVITLPPAVTAARAALTNLAAVTPPIGDHPDTAGCIAVEHLTAAVCTAALSGDLGTVDWTTAHAVRVAAEVDQDRRMVLVYATERLDADLSNAMTGAAEPIVLALQPIFAAKVTALREAMAVASQWPRGEALRAAPSRTRQIIASLDDLRDDLNAILAARESLRRLGYRVDEDDATEFDLLQNYNEYRRRAGRSLSRPPWHEVGILAWALLESGAQLWLPTPAQQMARYESVYGEATREYQANQRRTSAAAHAYGGMPEYASASDRPLRASLPTAQRLERLLAPEPAGAE